MESTGVFTTIDKASVSGLRARVYTQTDTQSEREKGGERVGKGTNVLVVETVVV